jgi:isochorismate hydrolase
MTDLCCAKTHPGPNGPLPKEIVQLHPNSTFVKRNGEVNAWHSEEFRNAVRATGKTQIILAGITTDVSIDTLSCRLYNSTIIPLGLHHVLGPLLDR